MADAGTTGPPPEEEGGDGLGVASLVLGIVGLFIGLLTIFGPRGTGVALGVVGLILGASALKRATTKQERGTAYGGIALGVLTLAVGVVVLQTR